MANPDGSQFLGGFPDVDCKWAGALAPGGPTWTDFRVRDGRLDGLGLDQVHDFAGWQIFKPFA